MSITLRKVPLGASGSVVQCLALERNDVYRLMEMGLVPGAKFTVLRRTPIFGSMELALVHSRLCIAGELANNFLVTLDGV